MCRLAHSKCQSLYDKLFIINIMKNKPLRWSIYCKRMTRVYIICTFISNHTNSLHRERSKCIGYALFLRFHSRLVNILPRVLEENGENVRIDCSWISDMFASMYIQSYSHPVVHSIGFCM